jgi:hypothetical protein
MFFNNSKPYDVFISYAVEDRNVTDELCKNLKDLGVKVWYSNIELGLGENISTTIAKGLKESRYGVVILSKHYTEGNWPAYELHSLLAEHYQNKQRILPIWHQITGEEVKQHYPDLMSIYGISTDKGILYAAEQIKKKIRAQNKIDMDVPSINRKKVWAIILLICIVIVAFFYLRTDHGSPVSGGREVAPIMPLNR